MRDAMPRQGQSLPVLLPFRPGAHTPSVNFADLLGPRTLMLLLAVLMLSAIAPAVAGVAAGKPGVFSLVWKWTPTLFQGFLFNILISFMAMAIGTALGCVLGLLQVSLITAVRRTAWVVTQFFRNAPWLVLLFYCILLIPFELDIFGTKVPFPAWIKSVIGLSLPVMAYVSEFVRGAVQSIPSGQWESAESLSFSRVQTMRYVILPQCVKRVLPSWMNLYAILTMATPLVSIVGVSEVMTLTRGALTAEARTDLLIPMYLFVLTWFFVYCYPISRLTARLERRFAVAG